MKKILLALALCLATAAHAAPWDIQFMQRNGNDNGNITRTPAQPTTQGLANFNTDTLLPDWVTLDSTLSITSGVLGVNGLVTPVNADWNASSGLAQVLNKPTLATVATSGAYGDLTGKPTIPTVTAFNFGAANVRTLAVSTAYQATDPTKAAVVTVTPLCTAAISLTGGSTCAMQARIGTTSALSCSTGTVVSSWTNGNTGTLTLGLALNQIIGAPGGINLPIGGYFILCATSGTFTFPNAVDQSAG